MNTAPLKESAKRVQAALAARGFAFGGVPPVGHREAPVTLFDRDLLGFQEIWAAAGTPNAVFRLKPGDLVAMTGGRIADVKQT